MNWQFLIGHPVSSAAASNQSIHSIHPVHHHSRHHQVIHNDVVDDDEVLIIKFHSPFIISIYEPLSRIREDVRNLRLLQPKRQAKCLNQDISYQLADGLMAISPKAKSLKAISLKATSPKDRSQRPDGQKTIPSQSMNQYQGSWRTLGI